MTLPAVSVQFSPSSTSPFDTTPTWVELGDGGPHGNRVLELDWTDGKQADLEEYPPGEATIVLRNDDRLFDPEHASGTYYGQLNPRVPFRIRATYSAVTYDLFYGFVETGWEQAYDPPDVSYCTVKLVDLVTVLAQYRLPSALEAELLSEGASLYAAWMLEETAGATAMEDKSPNNYDGTYVDGTTALSTSVGTLTGLNLDGEHWAIAPTRFVNATFEAVIDLTQAGEDLTNGARYAILETGDGAYRGSSLTFSHQWGVEIVSTADKTARMFHRGDGLLIANQGYSTAFRYDRVRHVALQASASLVVGQVRDHFIDGVLSNGTTDPPAFTGVFADTRVGGTKANGGDFRGGLAGVAGLAVDLTDARILAHADAALAPLDGLRTDEQIQWVLDAIGVPSSLYNLEAGETVQGPLDTAGANALELIREITAAEQGAFYVAHHDGGKLHFRSRYASFNNTRSTSTQATFSDDGTVADTSAARVVPGSLELEPNGVAGIINQANVTWRGGTVTVDQSAGSPYGPRPVSIDSQASTPALARGVGEWVIALNDTPRSRVRKLGIDPGANHSEFVYALATRIGDRVDYRSIPQNAGSATTKALEVIGRRHHVADVGWQTDFYLGAAPNVAITLFKLGVSQLGGTHVLAY